MIQYYTPTYSDVVCLMHNLRPHDRQEMEAVGGVTDEALWNSIRAAAYAYAVFDCGVLVCICGVNPHPHDAHQGIVWLLGTNRLDSRMKSLHRLAPRFLAAWHEKFPVLTNHTDQRNTKVLRWLQRLGFKFINVNPVGPDKVPFIHFIRECYV